MSRLCRAALTETRRRFALLPARQIEGVPGHTEAIGAMKATHPPVMPRLN